MIRLIPWMLGVIVIGVAIMGWLESRDEGGFSGFVDRARYGDEGPLEKAGRKIDEAVDEVVEDLKND